MKKKYDAKFRHVLIKFGKEFKKKSLEKLSFNNSSFNIFEGKDIIMDVNKVHDVYEVVSYFKNMPIYKLSCHESQFTEI